MSVTKIAKYSRSQCFHGELKNSHNLIWKYDNTLSVARPLKKALILKLRKFVSSCDWNVITHKMSQHV